MSFSFDGLTIGVLPVDSSTTLNFPLQTTNLSRDIPNIDGTIFSGDISHLHDGWSNTVKTMIVNPEQNPPKPPQ